MIYGQLFKVFVPLVVIVISACFLGCDFTQSNKNFRIKWIDENFLKLKLKTDYVRDTEGLILVTRDWEISASSFKHAPTQKDLRRYQDIREFLIENQIKSVYVELNGQAIEWNFIDAGVFGDYYLSLVYAGQDTKSTLLTTPEVWSCRKYKGDSWYLCEESEQ